MQRISYSGGPQNLAWTREKEDMGGARHKERGMGLLRI